MIPVSVAEKIAVDCSQLQVIVFGWDGVNTCIATFGVTVEDCAQAADGANYIKHKWSWPDSNFTEPPRVQKLLDIIKLKEARVLELETKIMQLLNTDMGTHFGQH